MARIIFDLPERFPFSTTLPVLIGHVNYSGHLDNAQLLTLVSEARVRFFKSAGYAEWDVEGRSIVVGDMVVQYKSEAFQGDVLRVSMVAQDFGKYGFDLAYRIDGGEPEREIARGKVGLVFVDAATKKVAPVPEAFIRSVTAG